MRQPTITDIAKQSGTDTGTVSRILSGRASEFRISRKRAELVKAVASRLGYVPNASAQAFRTGRFGALALLMGDDPTVSYITPHLLYGLDDALASRDMHLVVAKAPGVQPDDKGRIPRVLRSSMVDGVLLNYTHRVPDYLAALIDRRGLPLVWVNAMHERAAVYMDDLGASIRATKHLLDLGHERIDYIDPWKSADAEQHHSRRNRFAGYADTMRAAGIEPRAWTSIGSSSRGEGIEASVREVLERPDRPTALISFWFNCVPTIERVAAANGLRIPGDLSVITFGPEKFEGYDLRVSSMQEQTYLMGQICVEMMCGMVDGIEPDPPARGLPFVWQDNGTCGRINRKLAQRP